MKQFLNLFHLVVLCSICEGYYRLYHTHYPISNNDHDCLYRFENSSNDQARHLVPYCIRSQAIYSKEKCFGTNYTFIELRFMNVTSQQLLDWFSPIDVVDDYASYLLMEKINDNNEQIYCNCSNNLSFGKYCQYRFKIGNEISTFHEIVDLTLMTNALDINDLYMMNDQDSTTCYVLFNCKTYTGLCLDWREIADGLVHCINGADEENFVSIELNDCDPEKEYRCRNGLCIPRSFIHDRTFDCPDWYDETNRLIIEDYLPGSRPCYSAAPTAECEEYNIGLGFFSCGDGQIVSMNNEKYDTCSNLRYDFMLKNIFQLYFNEIRHDPCYLAILCASQFLCLFEPCPNGLRQYCEELLVTYDKRQCHEHFFYPPGPFVFPFIRLLYKPRDLWGSIQPDFICWNRSTCNIYNDPSSFTVDGFDCVESIIFMSGRLQPIPDFVNLSLTIDRLVIEIQHFFSQCNHQKTDPNLYTCSNRLSISSHRILDGHFHDCSPWWFTLEDEKMNSDNYIMACHLPDRLPCGSNECVSRYVVRDGMRHCPSDEDELFFAACTDAFDCQIIRESNVSQEQLINYQELCNGAININHALSDLNDTDETDCEMWPCQSSYTQCDGHWHRQNGCDELNCSSTQQNSCAHDEHPCAYFNSSIMGCLPLSKNGDGHFDCLFGTDERATLLKKTYSFLLGIIYPVILFTIPCWNHFKITIPSDQICNRIIDCPLGDDELFCEWHQYSECDQLSEFTCKNGMCISKVEQWCNGIIDCFPDGEDERLCDVMKPRRIPPHHELEIPYQPFQFDRFPLSERRLKMVKNSFECHRGIIIYNQLENMNECLCPPSYYGDRCERQSERLTIFYRIDISPTFDRLSVCRFVFYLLDENNQVLSYETMIYTIFNDQLSLKQMIYLNYPRFLDGYSQFKQKSVRIDAYRGTNVSVEMLLLSWFYIVPFSSFLPVTRLVALLYLEESFENQIIYCRQFGTCHHGVCQVYINTEETFCRCDEGWFGAKCDEKRPTDLCVGLNCSDLFSKCVVYNNNAFCLCALGRQGPKCETPFDGCLSIRCQNSGTCVSLDERTISHVCICPNNYFGNLCQYRSAQLKLNIPSNIPYIPLLIIHFLHAPVNVPGFFLHQDFYFYRNVYPRTQLITNDRSNTILSPFIFVQIFFDASSLYGSYYLISLSNANRSYLTSEIRETHRCPHVNEYLNSTLIKERWLKRIKFYHLLIKDVKCFHDEAYMCLIDKIGLPDCLIYNHNVANCSDRKICRNDGRCLQRKRLGQLDYVCICPQCTGGAFCQIQMSEYSLTLDSVLGQTILNDVSLSGQPLIIKVLIILISIMLIIGFISNICSLIVFRNKEILKIGCGYYLLTLSIINQITLIIFVSHTIYLIISQMIIINNNKLLQINCLLFYFIFQIFLSFCDWIYTCISFERTVCTIKGINFNKLLSVRMVKFVIPILFIGVILTSVHNIFNHGLITDPRADDRFWCVIEYKQPWLRTYAISIDLFNTFTPFCINLICAIILIISLSITRKRVAAKERYRTIIISQSRQHKDILVAPFTIIITKLPLVIASLVIKCISEQWHIYLSLFAYCLSLMPLISTFLIFVFPSNSYMKKFKESIQHFRRRITNN